MESASAKIIEAEELDRRARVLADLFAQRYKSPRWSELPEDLRESNRQAADHIAVKLRCIGLTEEQLRGAGCRELEAHRGELAEMEHRRWCAEKLLDGWLPLPPSEVTAWEGSREIQKAKKAQKHPP